LKDKQLKFYQITVKVEIFYRLRLSISMKQLHSMFSSKLLHSYSQNSLSEQHLKSSRSLTIKDDDHWKINDILNSRRYQDQIQYKIKWTELDRDNEWYYVDKEEFESLKEVLFRQVTLSWKTVKVCVSFILFMQTWIFEEKSNVTNVSELIKTSQQSSLNLI